MVERAVLDLLGFYQRDLRENGEGREALGRLGIVEPAVIEHFGLGYASGRALAAAGEPQRRELCRLGLVCRCREVLQDCVVLPAYETDGQLADLCGLRPYKSGPRYIHWQDAPRGLIGSVVLGEADEIVLCDTPLHALHVRQHGLGNVVALRSAEELAGHLKTFRERKVRKVHLVSRKQRQVLIPLLEKAGIAVEVVRFEHSEAVVPRQSLEAIREAAEDSAAGGLVKLAARSEDQLRFEARETSYRVEAGSGGAGRSRVRVEHGKSVFVDRVDLTSAAARRKFARLCAPRLGRITQEMEEEVEALAAEMDALAARAVAGKTQGERELSPEEREAALQVLRGEDVLEYQAQALEDHCGLIAEDANKKLALLVAASRLLEKPLGAIVRGPAGCGKSALIHGIGRVLPAAQVLNLSRLTPQALYFMPRESLQNRLLVCDEYEGVQESAYALRSMMSSQMLSLGITVHEGGRMPVTRTIELPARLAVLVSSTQPIDIENLSRFIELEMDSSPGQTRKVMQSLAGARASGEVPDSLAVIRNAGRLLRPCKVEIPYAGRLVYASPNVLARRQFAQVVGLVSAHAALFQHQRPSREEQIGGLVVEAVKRDYEVVYPLLSHVLEHFEEEVSPAAMQLLERLEAKRNARFTRQGVMDLLGWSYSKTYRVLQELCALDLLIPDNTTRGILRTYELAPYFKRDRFISQIVAPSDLKVG